MEKNDLALETRVQGCTQFRLGLVLSALKRRLEAASDLSPKEEAALRAEIEAVEDELGL